MAQNERARPRSETERHWDQLCLTVMTIGTAALAAVIVLYSLENDKNGCKTTADLIRATMAGLSALMYAFLTIQAMRTIFIDERLPEGELNQRKRRLAASTFSMFGTMITPIVALVLMSIIYSTYIPWYEETTSGNGNRTAMESKTKESEKYKPTSNPECPRTQPSNPATS